MPRTIHLMLATIRIDWRLAVAAVRAEPGGVLLAALVGALILSNLSGSVASAALLAQSDPAFGTAVLRVYAWTTALAAAGLAFAVGQPALAQRLTDHLRFAPVSRPQMFLALQTLTAAGRYAGTAGLVTIPLGLLLVALLPPQRAAAGAGAWLATLWMLPALIRVVSAALRILSYRVLFVLFAAAVAIAAFTRVAAVGPILVAALPPGVMVRIASEGSTPALWLQLVGWATLLLLLDYHLLSWREPRAPVRTGSRAAPQLPWWIRTVSGLCRVPPALLHGELLRRLRWRSFAIGSIGGSILFAMVYLSMDATWARIPLPLHVILLLMPPLFASGDMANMFATDRAGVQAYFLCVSDLRSVLRAKFVAVGVFVAATEVLIVGLILLQGERLEPAHIYAPVTAAGFFVWTGSVGLVVSVLFPKPVDPHRMGRGIQSAPAAAATFLADGFMVGLILTCAFLYGTGRAGGVALVAVAAVIVVLAGTAARLLPRVAHRLLHTRRERLAMELGLDARIA